LSKRKGSTNRLRRLRLSTRSSRAGRSALCRTGSGKSHPISPSFARVDEGLLKSNNNAPSKPHRVSQGEQTREGPIQCELNRAFLFGAHILRKKKAAG